MLYMQPVECYRYEYMDEKVTLFVQKSKKVTNYNFKI